MGRTGELRTGHGRVLTPALMPVVDPSNLIIKPSEIKREFKESLIMTNAYFLMKKFGDGEVHEMLDYNGPIATDSGGYQILRYGEIDADPDEVVKYQDSIGSDIATILDVPTGAAASRNHALETVRATVERAERATRFRSNPETIWCAPVQGGKYLDLVAECARRMGTMDYHIHAIGSPVEFLEGYAYTDIVDLVMTAKMHLPLDRPVHLFGAGHPMVLSMLVLMGCDLFDSASYILYARDGRYLTHEKTLKLEDLAFLPCECPVCTGYSVGELKEAPTDERIRVLARHNLHVLFGEIRRIRQAIVEGRLWEYVELKCRSHPKLLEGLRRLMNYTEFIERFDPVTKPSAFDYLGSEAVRRPEVLRHRSRMRRYKPPSAETLVLLPSFEKRKVMLENLESIHVVRLVPPFGVVPEELEDFYPLGQVVVPKELDEAQINTVCESLSEYLLRYGKMYRRVLLFNDPKRWGSSLVETCSKANVRVEVIELRKFERPARR